jgi:hypothetical protein
VGAESTIDFYNSEGDVQIIADLAVGTYAVGFALTDEGSPTTEYGMPESAALPGGTLASTNTSGRPDDRVQHARTRHSARRMRAH